METRHLTMAATFVALVAAGCASTDLEQKPAPATEPRAAAVTEQAPAPASVPLKPAGAPPSMRVDPQTDPNNILTHRSVYFDYDRPQSIGRVSSYHGNFLMEVRALTYLSAFGKEKMA